MIDESCDALMSCALYKLVNSATTRVTFNLDSHTSRSRICAPLEPLKVGVKGAVVWVLNVTSRNTAIGKIAQICAKVQTAPAVRNQ